MKLNITYRLALVFMLFAAGLVLAITLLYYNVAQRSLQQGTAAELESIASEKLAQLSLVLNERSALLSSTARYSEIANNLNGPAASSRLQEVLQTLLESGSPFVKMSILEAGSGAVIASTDPAEVGKSEAGEPFFVNGLKGGFIQVAYQNVPGADPRTVISTPIHNESGAAAGVLVGWMQMSDLTDALSQRTPQHQTLETYLVNKSGLFLTQPMLSARPLELVQTDNSQAAKDCLAGKGGVLSGSDYRDVPVLFAYRPAPQYELCLLTKIDIAEALDPIRRLTLMTALISSAALLAAVLVGTILARSFTRPILALQHGAEQFGEGNLDVSIPVESSDELGMLAGTFNTMAGAILEQKRQLESQAIELQQQVEDRTAELLKSEAELRALFSAMQDVVAVMDAEGRYLSGPPTGNRRMYAFLRLVIGKRLHDVFPAEVADNALAKIHEALERRTMVEFEHSLPIGRQERVFQVTISPLTENTVMWVAHDVTQKIRTRNALARNEALNRAIIDSSPVGIAIRDAHGRLVHANEAWCRIRGLSLDQILESEKQLEGQALVEQATDHSELTPHVWEIYQKGGTLYIPEVKTREAVPGAAQWVSLHFYGIVNDAGTVESVVTLTQDITSRKERERELQALISLSSALRPAVSRAEMQPIILEQLQRLLHVDGAGIVLRDPSNYDSLVGIGVGEWTNWDDAADQPADTGIAGEILRTAQPYITQDVHADPRLWGDYVGAVKALAAVPLIAHEQTIGVLAIGSRAEIPETNLRILSAIGEIAANALYRSILYDQTERQLQWLTAVRSIDQAITNSLDLHTTLNVVLEKAISHLKVNAADVLLLREGNRLVYAAGRGFKSTLASKANLLVGQLQAGKAALERRTVMVADFKCTEGWDCELMKQEGFRGYCAVPLLAKGQLKGVIEVFDRQPLTADTEWMSFLESLAGQAAISIDNAAMLETIQRTNMEMSIAYDVTLEGWSRAVEMHYRDTPGHTERIADLTQQLAREMGVEDDRLIHVRRGALLHDVGTIMIPEKILLKSGPLTPKERRIMEQHPGYSHEMLSPINFLRPALDIPYCHHENWDGTGYPQGLKGEGIPLAARIFAVAEAWESLTHDRQFRKAWAREDALKFIFEQSGKRFDPRVVASFRRMIERI